MASHKVYRNLQPFASKAVVVNNRTLNEGQLIRVISRFARPNFHVCLAALGNRLLQTITDKTVIQQKWRRWRCHFNHSSFHFSTTAKIRWGHQAFSKIVVAVRSRDPQSLGLYEYRKALEAERDSSRQHNSESCLLEFHTKLYSVALQTFQRKLSSTSVAEKAHMQIIPKLCTHLPTFATLRILIYWSYRNYPDKHCLLRCTWWWCSTYWDTLGITLQFSMKSRELFQI